MGDAICCSWHIPEVVGSCPVNYYTTKSQEHLGKIEYCSQNVRRKINLCFSVGEQVYKNEFVI